MFICSSLISLLFPPILSRNAIVAVEARISSSAFWCGGQDVISSSLPIHRSLYEHGDVTVRLSVRVSACGGPPLTLFEVLVVSVPNALFWAIVLYALYRLGSWTLNLFGLEVTIGRKRS